MNNAFSETDYISLCKAISLGVTNVKYGDKEVTYRDLTDMLRTKQIMEQALGKSKSRKVKYIQHSKGLN